MKQTYLILPLILTVLACPTAFASKLSASECRSNGNAFTQDDCKSKRVSASSICTMFVENGAVTVQSPELTVLTGQTALSAPVGRFYQMSLGDSTSVTRHNLNFGGLNRGMIMLASRNNVAVGVMKVEIYLNHDGSGQTYTRLICSGR